jgi:hypothetical protein
MHAGRQTGPVTDEEMRCSAKGCQAVAGWALRWNNPKIHTPERRKVWLACDDHKESLADFLNRRSFLRDVVPVGELTEQDG